MTASEYDALRAEVWQHRDGTYTHVIAAVQMSDGSVLVTLGNGFSAYYAELPKQGYTRAL